MRIISLDFKLSVKCHLRHILQVTQVTEVIQVRLAQLRVDFREIRIKIIEYGL